MAHIDFSDGYFHGIGTWEERKLWKAAQFKWSALRRAWITDREDHAKSVKGVTWTNRALKHIDAKLKVQEAALVMSYAAASDYRAPVPDGLHPRTGKPFEPFPYQHAGVEFCLPRKDTLIADQPGLGKTIEAILLFNADPSLKQTLVVCPASLKENWRREFDLWKTRDVSVGIAKASEKRKIEDGFYKNGKPKFKTVTVPDIWPDTDVVIINYDIVDRFTDRIKGIVWDYLVCDEAHALKSDESGRTLFILGGKKKVRGVKNKWETIWFNAIEANRRVFLTGTPLMNRPIEIWPMVREFDKEGLGRNWTEFVYTYCAAWHDPMRGKFGKLVTSGASNMCELGRLLRSAFMIRRLKKDVLPELPLVFRQVVIVDSPELKELVARESEIAEALNLYIKMVGASSDIDREMAEGDQIIEMAARMGFGDAIHEEGPNARELDMAYATAISGLEPSMVQILFEEMASVRREIGLAKLSAVVPWVKNYLDGGEKLVVFAYHSDVVKALAEALVDYNPACIWGGTRVDKRQAEVDRFQDDESCRVIVLNIDAGGVGYTLTTAHDVAFAEGDWVPTKLSQAIDRVCRIGQLAAKVIGFFLVANGSIDCRIAQSAMLKEDIINEALDT